MTVAIHERRDAAAVTGAQLRAWLENQQRREAAHTLATTAAGARCPRCRGSVVIGATVRVAHEPGCVRRAAMAAEAPRLAARLAAASGADGSAAAPAGRGATETREAACEAAPEPTAPEPEVTTGTPEGLDSRVRHPHRQRRRHHARQQLEAYTSQTRHHDGIRPRVVLRWFVSGARVMCSGWLATVRRIVRDCSGRLCALVDFDDCDGRWLHPLGDLEPEWAVAA